MKKYKILWTKHAALDLEEIVAFIAAENLLAASSLFAKVKSRCSKLSVDPERNRIVPDLKDLGVSNYREIILKPYRILHKISDSTIYVIALVDSRRTIEYFLFQRLIRD